MIGFSDPAPLVRSSEYTF
uniref:Uncharacterized protein n=1 Tax=Arundo donax TaxID=35708 RepID=A0A0A9B4N6_ARUDO